MANDVLIVDDESDIRMLISGILEDEGFETRDAGTAQAALSEVSRRRPNLVILDIWLQGSDMDGLEVLEVLQENHPDMPVLVISGHGNIETAVAAIKKGAYDYIEKPFKSDRLLICVERAIETARLKRENSELKVNAGGYGVVIGRSSCMNQLRQTIAKIAPTSSRILISGPPGAGKELIARHVHEKSGRSNGPFVILNCAAMVPDRLEAQLFGVEADGRSERPQIGTLEAAHGGTLYLDEVADMPVETQSKILRVLQDQRFERVGGKTMVEVDVRIVSSTCRNLEEEIRSRRFREDLFYRLNVVPLFVPPLRERREDIRELSEYFLSQSLRSAGLPLWTISEDAIATLQSYDWPGNVRELRNAIERVLIMMRGENRDEIRSDMLPPEINGTAPSALRWDGGAEVMGMPLREAREMFEREYLLAQITRFGGNISRTASFIGMERSALHRKLKMLGVHSVDKRDTQFDA